MNMAKTVHKSNQIDSSKLADAWGGSRLAVFGYASFIMAGSFVLLGGGGYLLDQLFNTGSIFLIIGVLLAFPVGQVWLYKKVKGHAKDQVEKLKS